MSRPKRDKRFKPPSFWRRPAKFSKYSLNSITKCSLLIFFIIIWIYLIFIKYKFYKNKAS
jgi:hypothetical protein